LHSGAAAYLHSSGIKHKDLKPSNILLCENGLWVTDFGTATDFFILTSSAIENGERGTPKCLAPKVAVYEPSGRAADIFSMGYIFFEVTTLCIGYTLDETQKPREANDRSFQSNLTRIVNWFDFEEISGRTAVDENFLGLVRRMEKYPDDRSSANAVEEEVALISILARVSRHPEVNLWNDPAFADRAAILALTSSKTRYCLPTRVMSRCEWGWTSTLGAPTLALGRTIKISPSTLEHQDRHTCRNFTSFL
jgi:serine/threonine protein kinase